MKKRIALLLLLCLGLAGCSGGNTPSPSSQKPSSVSSQAASSETVSSQGETSQISSNGVLVFQDSNGDDVTVSTNSPRVVCLYGSYADAWLSAGGELTGVTEDAVKERDLDVGDAAIVGTVKEPNAEAIISLDPDLVILSTDIAGHNDIRDVLENAGLACAYFQVDTFDDYDTMMARFCSITGRQDLYEQNVTQVREQIETVRAAFDKRDSTPSVLLIRAFSTGIKAKTDDELAGAILKDLGTHNIADDHPSMLEDLSLEKVIAADPDYIFVTTMGSEKKALAYLDSVIAENPAWQELSAVKEGRYVVLPKELFHYKPNKRWGESYEYLAECLDPSFAG